MDILRPFWTSVVHDEYREPFAGGATVFFNKAKSDYNWLNDLDSELVTTYKVVADPKQRSKLLTRVATEVANKKRWREVYEMTPKSELEIAFKYFYLNRTSFSGKLVSAAWGYRPKRSLPPDRWHERINPCGAKVSDVKITNWDFERVIEAPSKRAVLMYVDPPYILPPKKKHYRHGLNHDDHLRLANSLKRTKHKFFLTYDDAEEIHNLYSWAYIYPKKFFYRVDNSAVQNGVRRHGFELVISNYRITGFEQLNLNL